MGGTALGDSTDNLQMIECPYMSPVTPQQQEHMYTLVLDLDETLVHYVEVGNQGECLIRPGAIKFLEEMGKYFEVVIFTAATQDYADWAIEQIDHQSNISDRFYRQHAIPCGPVYIKDLSRLGRDLNRMIIVDNVPENF